jgi:integrase
MSLTKRSIDAATYAGKDNSRCVLWDDDPRGLGLRIFPSGHKSFLLSYRIATRKKLMTLGDYGVLTLDEARKRAKRELAAIENDDADPLATKRQRDLEARTGTIEQTFKAYLADRKPKRADDLLALAKRDIFPSFGHRGWRELRRSELREWHAAFAGNYTANRALQALRAALYWRLWREDDDGSDKALKRDARNPCAGIALRKEKPRQVRLELSDVAKLESAIDAESESPYMRALFRFLLATGCRRGEALSLRWDDVDLGDNAAITFRDTKNGTDRQIPLSAFAKRLIKGLPRIDKNPFVFVGHRHGTHLQSVAKCWQRIRKRAGIEHVRIHDLRRSFGSWLADGGFTSKQIGEVLGHRTDVTSRVYMALGEKSKRAAVNAVDSMMTGKKAPVAKLPKRGTR